MKDAHICKSGKKPGLGRDIVSRGRGGDGAFAASAVLPRTYVDPGGTVTHSGRGFPAGSCPSPFPRSPLRPCPLRPRFPRGGSSRPPARGTPATWPTMPPPRRSPPGPRHPPAAPPRTPPDPAGGLLRERARARWRTPGIARPRATAHAAPARTPDPRGTPPRRHPAGPSPAATPRGTLPTPCPRTRHTGPAAPSRLSRERGGNRRGTIGARKNPPRRHP